MIDIKNILAENKKRNNELDSYYNPVTGYGSLIERFRFYLSPDNYVLLPVPMKNEEIISLIGDTPVSEFFKNKDHKLYEAFTKDYIKIRIKHDFEYWAYTFSKISDKESGVPIQFKLNRPQRRLLRKLESMRLAGVPIRIIILKARQWGGSTLVQIYMDWLQLVHRIGWNSAIVADIEEQARTVRNFQTNILENYKLNKITLKNFEGSPKNKQIVERNCVISIASMQKPHSLRSKDLKMAHLTEVGFWVETEGKKPRDLIRSIRGTIKPKPDTMIALESTANGVGNFFHKEYLDADSGKTSYSAFFVPWYEDERNRMKVDNPRQFVETWTKYEKWLWEIGVTLEGINWYRYVLTKEYGGDTWSMNSENPTTPDEAFQSTGVRYIPPLYIKRIDNYNICNPLIIGDFFPSEDLLEKSVEGLEFVPYNEGNGFMWKDVDRDIKMTDRYLVVVDVGGKSKKADWSVIRVLDRFYLTEGGVPEFIFTWRGHLDPDLVAWKSMQIATYYNYAMLVIESNYFESRAEEKTVDHSITVINIIAEHYDNVYARTRPDKITDGMPIHWGFHMNKQTKPLAYSYLLKCCRLIGFVEHDARCITELKTLELDERGRINAVEGCHDDITDTTATGLYISEEEMSPPQFIVKSDKKRIRVKTEATL